MNNIASKSIQRSWSILCVLCRTVRTVPMAKTCILLTLTHLSAKATPQAMTVSYDVVCNETNCLYDYKFHVCIGLTLAAETADCRVVCRLRLDTTSLRLRLRYD